MKQEKEDEKRPDLSSIQSGGELRRWYWLKEELLSETRVRGLSTSGSKAELTERLAHFLDTGEKRKAETRSTASSFDWAHEMLTPETVITDSYRNGPNVRAFFKQHYGAGFTFNIAFMQWMKENVGKTLADALEARKAIAERERTQKPAIPEGNQYNAYTRAFFEANPGRSAGEARACWAWKRSRPGHNRYENADLQALVDPVGDQSK